MEVVGPPKLRRASTASELDYVDNAPLKKLSSKVGSSGALGPREPPADFICPITQEVMYDPVIAHDGHTYERAAIEAWMTKSPNPLSPMTNCPLASQTLIPNYNLRSQIATWREE